MDKHPEKSKEPTSQGTRTSKFDGVTGRFLRLTEAAKRAVKRAVYGGVDPELILENEFQDLQSHLILIRQAVAAAINTEKWLEEQLQEEKELAETSLSNTNLAEQNGNSDEAQEARLELSQHNQAAEQLQRQLTEQKTTSSALRQKLFDTEIQVQEAYVRKQVLLARHKAAKATLLANEILAMTNENEVLIAINRLETMVAECEQKAAEGTSTVVSPLQNGAGLSEAIVTLRRTIDAIARLQLLVDKRDLQKNLENQKRVDSEES